MEQIPTKRPRSNSDSDSSQSPKLPYQSSPPHESPHSLDISSPQRRRYSRRARQKPILTRHSYSIPPKNPVKMKKAKLSDSQESSEDNPNQHMYQSHGMPLYNSIHPSFQSLLSGLEASDDIQILQSLTQLSMDLAMIHEELLANLPLEQLVVALISCLNKDTLQDIPLYAMNSLTNILDAIPNVAGLIVANGGISILSSKLMNFEFIDMAEHAIKTLEKMSYEHASAIIKEGAFGMMIGTIDFFEAEIQKKILSFALNVARSLNSQDHFIQHVAPALPALINMLSFRGADFIPQNEKTLDFFTVLTTSLIRMCCTDYEKLRYFLQVMIDQGLMKALFDMQGPIPSLLSKIFKLLHILCKNASSATHALLALGISNSLKETLLKWQEKNEKSETSIMEALHLTEAIIPKIHSDDVIEKEKMEIYMRFPQYLQTLGDTILPQIISLYEHFASKEMKTLVITILDKILEQSPPELMLNYVAPQHFSTFIAELLSSKDLYTIKNALKIINVLYDKIPDQVAVNFIREGVLERVQNLKNPEKLRELNTEVKTFCSERMFIRGSREDSRFIDPLMMFRFSHGLERSNSVHEDPTEMMPNLRRYRSESMDITHDQKKDIISLCKSAIDKSKNFENKRAAGKQRQLKEITNKLENGDGESAEDVWKKLISILESEEAISQFEISSSGLAEAIWKWLNFNREEAKNMAVLKRVEEFLRLFFETNSKNEPHISSLISLLLGAVQFLHGFTVSPADNSLSTLTGIRSLSQRVRLHFQYSPDPIDPFSFYDLSTEYSIRHNFFSSNINFNVAIEQFNTFDAVKSLLLRVRSKDELLYFQEAFHHNIDFRRDNNLRRQIRDLQSGTNTNPLLVDSMDLDNELDEFNTELVMPRERKPSEINGSLVVNLYCKGAEISKGMSVFEIMNRLENSEEPVIQFKFCRSSLSIKGSSFLQAPTEIYHDILEESQHVGLDISEKIYPYLRLLKLIFRLNENLPQIISSSSLLFPFLSDSLKLSKIDPPAFKSQKLSALLTRQLQDSLPTTAKNQILNLPKHCHFLFPYTLRTEFIQATGFGGFRSLQYFLDKNQNKERYRVQKQKQKVRINREKLLQSAMVIMSDIRLLKQGILEIEFENEIGTGQGPTLEFYSLVAREIRGLNIWRNQGEESGLFPSPLQASDGRYRDYFTFLGRFVAKALIDRRYVDIPISPVFWKLVLNEPTKLSDVLTVDNFLGKFLLELQELVNKKKRKILPLTFRGANIDDLALTFTLPGYDSVDLKRNGKNTYVNLENLEEYTNSAAQYTLLQNSQAQAFRSGLESLFPCDSLKSFMGCELETLICGESDEKWDLEELKTNIKPAHGYSSTSPTFKNLLSTMSEFSFKEKRLFMQFISGSPRLPPGGFAGLNPKLTVVRKEASMPGIEADDYLPSVMTCQNYLKIPDYTTLEILQRNLKYAMEEGHEAFHLS